MDATMFGCYKNKRPGSCGAFFCSNDATNSDGIPSPVAAATGLSDAPSGDSIDHMDSQPNFNVAITQRTISESL